MGALYVKYALDLNTILKLEDVQTVAALFQSVVFAIIIHLQLYLSKIPTIFMKEYVFNAWIKN